MTSTFSTHVESGVRLASVTTMALVLVLAAAVAIALQRRGDRRELAAWLQWSAAGLPLVAAVALFFVGLHGHVDAAVAPGDALEIGATAEKWKWTFTYPNGQTANELRVPAGRPVKLVLASRDVAHRFAVPALHVEAEARPGEETSVWFQATAAGDARLFCGDACAAGHEEMATRITVLPAAEFDGWLEGDDDPKLTPAQRGAKLFAKSACNTCHSTDGAPGTGPTFKGLFGREEHLADGSAVTVDEAYLKESILDPAAKVVKGFQPVMPAFRGQLDEKQVEALVAFIKDVKP